MEINDRVNLYLKISPVGAVGLLFFSCLRFFRCLFCVILSILSGLLFIIISAIDF